MSEFKFNYVEMDYGNDKYHEGEPTVYITPLSVEAGNKTEALKIAYAYADRLSGKTTHYVEEVGDEVKLSRDILMKLILGE